MDDFQHELPAAEGDLDLIIAVGDHCEKLFGKSDVVYHEENSDFVRIDVHRFGPDPVSGLVTFVTSGMAEKPMNVPARGQNAESFRYTELILQMPAELEEEYGKPGKWPFMMLRNLARMPHQVETWLWAGHTVGDHPAVPFPGSHLSVAVLYPSFLLPPESWSFTMDDGRFITLLTLGFLTDEERAYSKAHYQEGFFDEMERRGREIEEFLIFDPDRPSLFSSGKAKPKWKFWGR